MSFLKQGNWQWIKEKKKSRRGEITYAPTGVWVISVEDLNKILVDTFSSEFSRDVIWEVAKAKATKHGTQFMVRKAIPEHLTPVCRKTPGKWKPTRQEEKSIKRYMASFIEKRLEGFEKHFQDHIQTQDEDAKELESPTFEAFATGFYYPTQIQPQKSRVESMFIRWAYPVIGHLRMSEIQPGHIDQLIGRAMNGSEGYDKRKKRMVWSQLSENTANTLLAKVARVFNIAEEEDAKSILSGKPPHILMNRRPHNKRLLSRVPKMKTHTKIPPSRSDNMKLMAYTKKHHPGMYLVITLDLYLGLRIGELLALKWSDVRWTEKKIEVTKQWDSKTNQIRPTKTGGETTRIALDNVLDELKIWREVAPKANEVASRCVVCSNGAYKMKGGRNGGLLPICTGDHIISHPNGNPFGYAMLNNRLNIILKEIGIKKEGQSFHAFRRSFVSEIAARIVAKGGDPFSLLKRIGGWKNRQTVEQYLYDMYRHKDREILQQAFDDMGYKELMDQVNQTRDPRERILKTRTDRNGTYWYIRFSYTEDGKEQHIKKSTELKATEDNKEAALEFGAALYKKVMGFDIQ